MSSGPEKTHIAKPPVSTQAAKGSFFRKAGSESFFGAKEGPSFFPAAVQPKLEVSHPDDPQEKEADAVAENVMRMAEPAAATPGGGEDKKEEGVQRKADPVAGHAPTFGTLHRQAGAGGFASHAMTEDEGGADTEVQAKAQSDRVATFIARSARGPPAGQASAAQSSTTASFETSLASSKGSGSPLSNDTRQTMESRFGADFGGVRIHTGSSAESLSAGISAQAFTHGNDIYFNSGKFSPNSATGGHLLAHELTHTIQQGASQPRADAKAQARIARSIQRKGIARSIQRTEAGSQRTAAVEMAKAEVGKVSANKEGPDGQRMGWERLLEFFKTTFGADKILPEGAAFQQGYINEAQIKKKSSFNGDVMAGDGTTVLHNQPRDAMASWCGIFAFWALNKGGIPLKKWVMGGSMIPAEAAYPPSHQPEAGDIAYRKEFSHYALVVSSDGSNVTSVNGNTAGDDNVGGEIQVQTHPKDHWFSFIDPTQMMEGALRAPGSPDTPGAGKARSLKELRQQLKNGVHRKAEGPAASIQAAGEAPAADTSAAGEKEDKEEKLQAKNEEGQGAKETTAASAGDTGNSGDTEDEKPGSEGAGAGGFDINRSVAGDSGVNRSADNDKQLAGATAVPAAVTSQAAGHPAAAVTRKEETGAQGSDAVQRQPMSLHNRGPPRAPPQINATVSRRIQRGFFSDAWDAVSSAVSEAAAWVEKGLDKAKEWIFEKIRDFVANIKGYKMLCLILGKDPITDTPTPLTGENLLEAGLDILPGGWMFKQLFIRLGIYGDAAKWLQGRIDDLGALASDIGTRFETFLDGLSLDDIGDPDGVISRVEKLLTGVISDIVGFIERSATSLLDMIKKVMIRELSAFIRKKIPKLYPLLCVALGFDPQTMLDVPRNGTNILNALLAFSDEGEEQKKQIRESGTFKKIAAFIDEGISVFSTAYTKLKAAILGIWKFVTIDNLFHPIRTFGQIYDTFADPIGMVLAYVLKAAKQILIFIKEFVIKKISAFAKKTRGYPLLCVILGKDPFTGDKVPRTVDNLVKGFMSLMEGGEQQFEQLKQSGAIDKIVAKVEAAVARLNLTPAAIIALFKKVWEDMSLKDLAHPIDAFTRIVGTLAQPIFRIIRFVIEIVLIAIEAVLILMNFPFDIVSNILAKARQAWNLIKNDPVGFFKNLLACIKQGFIQFFDNIAKHLLNGLVGWLMGELKDAGVPILSDFSLQGVISWVLEVLGISMEKIWQKLAAHPRIGPEKVAKIRSMINKLDGIWTFIKDVQERGMAAIWDKIQEQLSNLWDTVLGAVKSWIMEKIIGAVVTKLLSMLDPTGIMAVINSCIAIYKAVQSFIKYITEMLKVVNSFVEGVVQIAEGNIKVGADYLENSMDKAMPIVIGFLANQVGLGGIGSKVAELIGKAQEMVDKALTWLVNKAVDTGFAIFDRLVSMGKSAIAAVKNWLGLEKKFKADDGKEHKVYMGGSESSPVLMVASNPTAFADFVATVTVDDKDPKKAVKEKAKTDASKVAGKIDDRKAKKVAGETDADKMAAVQLLLDELATHTVHLFGDVAEAGEPEVKWPTQHATFGKSMTAVRLNKKQKLKGSSPTSKANPNYTVLNQRRDEGNPEASYYVKGHLLNETLGGKGDWDNLTPLSRDGNSGHESSVESLVKAGVQSGSVVAYEVTASYGYGGNAGVIPAADPDKAAKLSIIAEEANVPTSLDCKAWSMEKKGDNFEKKDSIVSIGVPNPIGQTADSYKLSTSSLILDYAKLEADAKAGFIANPTESWAAWKSKDKVHKESIAALEAAPATKPQVTALENLFKAHFRARDKDAELAEIGKMKKVEHIQTWNAFKGARSFYADTDALVNEVQAAFDSAQSGLRSAAFTAAEAAIPATAKGLLWRDFKAAQKISFQTVGPTEADRLIKIQEAFEKHQKSLP